MARIKFRPGMICTIDPDNKLKQDTNGLIAVELLSKNEEKSTLFETFWNVRQVDDDIYPDDDSGFICPQKILHPGGMVIIRLPPELPTINQRDLDLMQSAITNIETYGLFKEKDLNRLKALNEKLKLSKQLREI